MAFFTDHGRDEPQYHIRLTEGDVGGYVLLPGDPARTDLIAAYLDDANLVAHNREHKTWTGYLDGEKVTVTSTGMGCPSTAIAVEELINLGAHTLIRVGNAGRVAPEAFDDTLDGVITTAAVRDEGTTVHYIPVEYPAVADRRVVAALSDAAKAIGANFAEGITQSKESFYGQVQPEISPAEELLRYRWKAWQKGHVLCSEMEAAALFIVGGIRGCRTGGIMNFKDIDTTIRAACGAVRLLIARDKAAKG